METATERTNSAAHDMPAAGAGNAEPVTKPIDYGLLNVTYFALLAALVAAQERRDSEERIRGVELLPLGAATFSLSKAIAREKIGSWVRDPFVDETASGQASRAAPAPRHGGAGHVLALHRDMERPWNRRPPAGESTRWPGCHLGARDCRAQRLSSGRLPLALPCRQRP